MILGAVVVLDVCLIALGAGLLMGANVLRVRHYPEQRIGRQLFVSSRRTSSRHDIWAFVPGIVVVSFAGSGLQGHIGWWGFVIGVGVLVLSPQVPTLVHDWRLKQQRNVH